VSPIHLGIGAVCIAAVVGLLAWLELRRHPTDQHFVFANEYEDATCTMNFADGTRFRFSVDKDDRYTRTFKAPKIGFIIMRCETASGVTEAPGHFHLIDGGGLTDTMFTAEGNIEARYYDRRRVD
jgi:hypothetical protein